MSLAYPTVGSTSCPHHGWGTSPWSCLQHPPGQATVGGEEAARLACELAVLAK